MQNLGVFGCCLLARCTLWGSTPLSAAAVTRSSSWRRLSESVITPYWTQVHSNKRFDTVFEIQALSDFRSNYDTEFSASRNCLYFWSNIEAILGSLVETQNPVQLTQSTVAWPPPFPLSSPINILHPPSSFLPLNCRKEISDALLRILIILVFSFKITQVWKFHNFKRLKSGNVCTSGMSVHRECLYVRNVCT